MADLVALLLSSGMRTGFVAVSGIALGLIIYGLIAASGLTAIIDESPFRPAARRVLYLLWSAWESWVAGG